MESNIVTSLKIINSSSIGFSLKNSASSGTTLETDITNFALESVNQKSPVLDKSSDDFKTRFNASIFSVEMTKRKPSTLRFKDTHWEKASSNKTPNTYKKYVSGQLDIWCNESNLYKRFLH